MGKKKVYYKHNNESYQEFLNKRYKGQFQLIDDYSTKKNKVKIKCLRCNYEFDCCYNTLANTSVSEKCPNCLKHQKEQLVADRFKELNPTLIVNNVCYYKNELYTITCICKIHNISFKRNSKITVEAKPSGKPLCPECIKEYDIRRRIIELKSKFPIQIHNGITVNFLDDYLDEKRHLWIDCIDQYGYKYRVDSNRVVILPNSNYTTGLRPFFKNNPHTFDNINVFLKINKIPLVLIDEVDYNKGSSKMYRFQSVDGRIIKQKWNSIQSNPNSYINIDEKIAHIKRRQMTKERAIQIICKKEKELGRPLLQTDFENVKTTEDSIGIRVIWKFWGTFSNMIAELGLIKHDSFYRPNDVNYTPHDEVMNLIKSVCEKVKSNGRNTIMYSDFEKHTNLDVTKFRRHCALENTTLNDIVRLYGCELQRAGNGMNYRFEDGEFTVSKYEYDFSQFLRENGFEYGKTYFRNIYYKTLDNEYAGNMNCDYCVNINGHLIYIELAGILGNKEHQNAYRNNVPLKSKSKEEYRQKLNQKRDVFERNGLEYYILLPDEMNENIYKNIINKYQTEVA